MSTSVLQKPASSKIGSAHDLRSEAFLAMSVRSWFFSSHVPHHFYVNIGFWKTSFFKNVVGPGTPFGSIFGHIGPTAVFSRPLPRHFHADVGLERTGFFKNGVGPRSSFKSIFHPIGPTAVFLPQPLQTPSGSFSVMQQIVGGTL